MYWALRAQTHTHTNTHTHTHARPEGYLGELETWNKAEAALTEALNSTGLPWTINEADGAFYGPKIDITGGPRGAQRTGRRRPPACVLAGCVCARVWVPRAHTYTQTQTHKHTHTHTHTHHRSV